MSGLRVSVGVALVLVLAGCTRVYWDREYFHDKTERRIPKEQQLRVVSAPPARLSVDGRWEGRTPCDLMLSYSVDSITFVKNKYRKQLFAEPEVIDTVRKVETVSTPETYKLVFDAPGHDLVTMSVVAPYGEDTLSVTLPPAKVYWDDDWRLRSVRKGQARVQRLEVTSTPRALLHVDGKMIGMTPAELSLPYAADETDLVKHKYEDAAGKARRLVEEKTSTEALVKPTAHILQFQAQGYYDLYVPLTVPHEGDTVSVTLQRAGAIKKVRSTLRVEARKPYFPEIEKILHKYSKAPKLERKHPEPVPDQHRLYFRQVYSVHVENALKFDEMVFELRRLSRQKHFVFDIVDASFSADFSTNILEAGIQHVVSVTVRPGSVLYLSQEGKLSQLVQVGPRPEHSFPVRLKPGERHIYVASKFQPPNADPLVVYKEIDVFAQTQREILAMKEFLAKTRVKVDDLRKHGLVKAE